jgi:peptidoglycan/LPS O-acetylase OafA/YrhL
MLHGVISNSVLPFSQYAFSMPAWSLSLEWQFYLVAPFVIALARQPRNIFWLALGVAVLEIAYRLHWLGEFQSPSLLPAAAGYFGVGIASRIAYPTIAGTLRHPGIIFALLIILVPLSWDAIPILAWVFVLTGLVVNWSDANPLSRVYRLALESRAATYFGSRSYSIYLCHPALIAVCHLLWIDIFPLASRAITFLALSVMVVPLTVITAELLHRGIERPGIALGSWLARRKVEGMATA